MRTTVRHPAAVTLIVLVVLAWTVPTHAQAGLPVFKTEAAAAFVWGEDNGAGVLSSIVRDPLTGTAIHKLNHGGVEVSSRAGFEKDGSGEGRELLSFTATIVNNTDSELSVRQGGASVDGRMTSLLPVVVMKKGLSKRGRNQVWELAGMNCFSSGFLPNQRFLSPNMSPNDALRVGRKTALTVSFVTKDPRYYSLLCSADGCFPKGIMRFSVTVNSTDFVFVWPGRTMVYCGK